MKLLLCAATEFEIRSTLSWIQEQKIKNIDVLITGVGLVSTAYHLTRRLVTEAPDFMLQAGIGGALDPKLKLNEVVAVSSDEIGDLGVEEGAGFRTLFDLGFADPEAYPLSAGRLQNHETILARSGLRTVRGVSVNEISTREASIRRYAAAGIGVESMEGAAFHYVALQEKIPFLQIRSLSNFAGERDKSRWSLAGSIESLNSVLRNYLINEWKP